MQIVCGRQQQWRLLRTCVMIQILIHSTTSTTTTTTAAAILVQQSPCAVCCVHELQQHDSSSSSAADAAAVLHSGFDCNLCRCRATLLRACSLLQCVQHLHDDDVCARDASVRWCDLHHALQ
jgi:hypothetical protein